MGNRFITALSGRYKHLLNPARVEHNEVACAEGGAESRDPEDRIDKTPDDADRATLADAPGEERAAKEPGAVSSWQLVLPGYEFSGGSLRAKGGKAVKGASEEAPPLSTAPTDAANEPPLKAPLLSRGRSLGLLGVGVSAGYLIAVLGFRSGDVAPAPELGRANPIMASTQVPCPPAPVAAAPDRSSSLSVPSMVATAPAAVGTLSESALAEEGVADNPVSIAEGASSEVAADVASVSGRAKLKSKAKKATTRIEMETRQVMVSGRAVAAVILLKRTGSKQGRARVRWKTLPGTATPAKDYQGAATTVQFADGQAQRTIFVPILQQPPGAAPRTFSVVLERAPRGSALGSVTSTTVTILGDG